MRWALHLRNSWQKAVVIFAAGVFLAGYISLASRHYLAWRNADLASPGAVQQAIQLEPWNASFFYQLAVLQFFSEQDFNRAIANFERAVVLNPYNGSYWLKLATSQSVLGNEAGQRKALQQAVWADHNDPTVGLEAAEQYLAQGSLPEAFELYRTVLRNEPSQAEAVLPVCLRAGKDIDEVLDRCVPDDPSVYARLLRILTGRNDGSAAAVAWDRLVHLQTAFEAEQFLPYVDYLLAHNQVAPAMDAWTKVTAAAKWSNYRFDAGMVNGGFENALLNGGFDWKLTPVPEVTAAISNQEVHNGTASFEMAFQGPAVADTGLSQLVSVMPGHHYRLEFSYRCEDLESGSGPRVQVGDPVGHKTLYLSDEMLGTSPWRQVAGEFTVPAEVRQVEIRVVRISGDKLVKGTLWLDDFSLKTS